MNITNDNQTSSQPEMSPAATTVQKTTTTISMKEAYYLWYFEMMTKHIGIAFVVVGIFGAIMTIISLFFLTINKKCYSKTQRKWYILIALADVLSLYPITLAMIDELLKLRYENYPIKSLLEWYLDPLGNVNFKQTGDILCKVFSLGLYNIGLTLMPVTVTMATLIKTLHLMWPLKMKAVLTNKINSILMVVSILLSMALTWIYSSSGYFVMGIKVERIDGKVKLLFNWKHMCSVKYSGTQDQITWSDISINISIFSYIIICGILMVCNIIILSIIAKSFKTRQAMTKSQNGSSTSETKSTVILLMLSFAVILSVLPIKLYEAYIAKWLKRSDVYIKFPDGSELDWTRINIIVEGGCIILWCVFPVYHWVFHSGINTEFLKFLRIDVIMGRICNKHEEVSKVTQSSVSGTEAK